MVEANQTVDEFSLFVDDLTSFNIDLSDGCVLGGGELGGDVSLSNAASEISMNTLPVMVNTEMLRRTIQDHQGNACEWECGSRGPDLSLRASNRNLSRALAVDSSESVYDADENDPLAVRKRQGSKSLPKQGMRKLLGLCLSELDENTNRGLGRPMSTSKCNLNPQSNTASRSADAKHEEAATASSQDSNTAGKDLEHTPIEASGFVKLERKDGTDVEGTANGTSKSDPFDGNSNANIERSDLSKSQKNERERKRRLTVSRGFIDLYNLLKETEDFELNETEAKPSSPISKAKINKVRILNTSINRIQTLEARNARLRKENARLRALLSS